jgi:hypothetical protein
VQQLSKDEALAAVTDAAHTTGAVSGRRYGDPDPAADHDGVVRTVIHTVTGMLRGADWDLDTALAFIQAADTVGWQRHIVGHDLVAILGDQRVRFDVQRTSEQALAA